MLKLFLLLLLLLLLQASPLPPFRFLFDSFSLNDLIFAGDASVDSSSVIRLTSNAKYFSMGRIFYPYIIARRKEMKISSFSTSFIFSVVSEASTDPGFGFAFILSNDTVPPGSPNGHYFGLFSESGVLPVAHLLIVEFDCGKNPEFDDANDNHIGINLNRAKSVIAQEAGYYNSSTGEFVPFSMRSGSNIQAWIEFDGTELGINVTIAPVGIPKPAKPLISFYSPVIATYITGDVYVGFSASRVSRLETQRILAWTLADEGVPREMNTSNLPIFRPETSSTSSLSVGLIVGIAVISALALLISISGLYWVFWIRKRIRSKDEDEVQSWEIDYWPHRFSYEELAQATKGFSEVELLGSGGFGRVFRGTDANNSMIAVKCVSGDSSQGFKEFMAEISSIGRLQHKNLVRMRGWCKKGSEMLLVYDYMPNGSLYSWIFNKFTTLSWEGRLLVLTDVAEGLNYLHNGWDHLVLHRDIKSSNILLDADMRGRLGDFGLAKLCKHGQVPLTTRLAGTVGYMAPELVKAAPTKASDIYSFGVVMLEVACGRRPTEVFSENKQTLVDWLRMLQEEGRLNEAADWRIAGEYKFDEMEMVLKLGLACCDADPKMRPSMKEVLSSLMTLKLHSSPDYLSSSKIQPINRKDRGQTSMISTVSVITDPGPRT